MERKIIECMKARGYELSYKTYDGKGNLQILEFLFIPENKKERFLIPAYCCTVDVEKESFSFSYTVPGSTNKLVMGNASPLWNDDHFYRLATLFESQAAILYKYSA